MSVNIENNILPTNDVETVTEPQNDNDIYFDAQSSVENVNDNYVTKSGRQSKKPKYFEQFDTKF